jgi:hypothetical protein
MAKIKIAIQREHGCWALSESVLARFKELSGVEYNGHTCSRTNRHLIQAIEEAGRKAHRFGTEITIGEIEEGTRYFIDEYDGLESIVLEDEFVWSIAGFDCVSARPLTPP